jgi:hypothetical protein
VEPNPSKQAGRRSRENQGKNYISSLNLLGARYACGEVAHGKGIDRYEEKCPLEAYSSQK